jgi:hypothetical protein
MTAQTVEAGLPRVPNNIPGIRALLSAPSRAKFDAELAEAAERDSLDAIRAFRKRWWVLAAVETDPGLLAGIDPNEPLYPSPFRR